MLGWGEQLSSSHIVGFICITARSAYRKPQRPTGLGQAGVKCPGKQMDPVKLGASLCCPLLLIAVDLSWCCAPVPVFTHEGQVQECIACVKGLSYEYVLHTEAYSHLSETTPTEEIAAPCSGKSKSLFSLLQTKDLNMYMLLLAVARFLMQ